MGDRFPARLELLARDRHPLSSTRRAGGRRGREPDPGASRRGRRGRRLPGARAAARRRGGHRAASGPDACGGRGGAAGRVPVRAARPRAAGRAGHAGAGHRAGGCTDDRGARAHRPVGRAPRHRGRGRGCPGLPRQGHHRRSAADPRDPLRRGAQAGRRVDPPPLRVGGPRGRELPARAWPAAAAADQQPRGRRRGALPPWAAPVAARWRLLRRRRVRGRLPLRPDRRRRRPWPRRGGARRLPADRVAHARARRRRPRVHPVQHGRGAGQRARLRRGLRDGVDGPGGPVPADGAVLAGRAPAAGDPRRQRRRRSPTRRPAPHSASSTVPPGRASTSRCTTAAA